MSCGWLLICMLATALLIVWPNKNCGASPLRYDQAFGQGYASQADVEAALGHLTFKVTACKNAAIGRPDRSVAVTATKPYYENRRVVEAVLYQAAQYAWRACPLHVILGGFERIQQLWYGVRSVELFLPDGSLAIRATGLNPQLGGTIGWAKIEDVGTERRRAYARAVARAAQQRRIALVMAQGRAHWAAFWTTVKTLVIDVPLAIMAFLVLRWFYRRRESILRWYYLLTPHPARQMVEDAITRGVALDGAAFAELMRPIPGGRVEKQVRAEQGRALAERARQFEERLRAEANHLTAAEARRVAAQAHADAEFTTAQNELAQAAVAHEKAKARLDALRKRIG
jgi:hypothetical protein